MSDNNWLDSALTKLKVELGVNESVEVQSGTVTNLSDTPVVVERSMTSDEFMVNGKKMSGLEFYQSSGKMSFMKSQIDASRLAGDVYIGRSLDVYYKTWISEIEKAKKWSTKK